MKALYILPIIGICNAVEPSSPSTSLIPQDSLGFRSRAVFKDLIWNADCEWFTKPAPLCRVSSKPMNVSKIHELAKIMKLRPVWNEIAEQIGDRKDGAFYYLGDKVKRFIPAVGGNPKTHAFFFTIADYNNFERDEDQNAIVKPLPSKEEAVAISREWMKKLGIDESLLYRQGSGPEGFEVGFRIDLVRRWNEKLKKDVEYNYGITLHFSQQIGGLPVLWNMAGGALICEISDGGEFASMEGNLTPWEKIADYPVLGKAEIEKAMREGFCWGGKPVECETITVNAIWLEAYHFRKGSQKNDFPLIYTFSCALKGGPDDGKSAKILMPALMQQRDKYGPLLAQSKWEEYAGFKESLKPPKDPGPQPENPPRIQPLGQEMPTIRPKTAPR